MAADEDNKEQVLKECEQAEEVMKDKQNQVKRKNYWVLWKIDLSIGFAVRHVSYVFVQH